MSEDTAISNEVVGKNDAAGKDEVVGVKDKVVGTRRNVTKPAELEVVGPRRDAAKVRRSPADEIELGAATPREATPAAAPVLRRRSEKSSFRGVALLVISALIMIAATLIAFFELERYRPVGDPLLADPIFSASLDGWARRGMAAVDPGAPGKVVLENRNPDGRTYLRRTIDLPPGPTLALLKATVSAENVVAGNESWERARVYLVPVDHEGEADWTQPHNLVLLRGTQPAETVSQVYAMPPAIELASLALEMTNATGRMTVGDLELYPVEELPVFREIALVLMAAWGVLIAIAAVMLFRSIPSFRVRFALGGMLGIFAVGLFMPAPVRDGLIDSLHMASAGEGGIEADMIGHGIVFAIMAFLVRIGRPKDPIWLHLGCWILIGVASEVLQLFTLDRSTSAVDFAVDGIGFVLGLTCAIFLPRLIAEKVPA